MNRIIPYVECDKYSIHLLPNIFINHCPNEFLGNLNFKGWVTIEFQWLWWKFGVSIKNK